MPELIFLTICLLHFFFFFKKSIIKVFANIFLDLYLCTLLSQFFTIFRDLATHLLLYQCTTYLFIFLFIYSFIYLFKKKKKKHDTKQLNQVRTYKVGTADETQMS